MLGPIFAREWLTVPRRPSHYVIRSGYVGLLWVLGWTAWQATVGWSQATSVADTSRFGSLFFQLAALVQLMLLPFLAAVFAASAVSQEKDRRTFILLLLTDLSSSEIVVGKLLGSLLQIAVLIISAIPVLALIMLLGGVAPFQVGQATLILASTCVAAGALGNLIALWRDKTFQSLALTVLFLVLYLCVVQGLSAVPEFGVGGLRLAPARWQVWLGPFQALQSVLEPRGGPHLLSPAYVFSAIMLLLSVLMAGWGMLRLRVWNPSGEPIMQRESPETEEEKDRTRAHAAPGGVRAVWANPIIWREIRTRAYGRRPLLVKLAYFVVLALVCYYALAPIFRGAHRTDFEAALGLVPVAILSLLLISAQAVTAVTSERDTGALDLLLVTDLTPREFIFGKLGGILYNTKEFLIPPLVLIGVYAWLGYLASPPATHPEFSAYKNSEALVCVGIAALVVLAFGVVFGLHVALRTHNSRAAIINALGTVFLLSVGTLVCIYLILINGRFEVQWLSFSLFLFAGIGGLWWVLRADRPSAAINVAAAACPLAVFYTATNVLVGKPGTAESTDPAIPFLVTVVAFGFALAAMLVPLLSEFDVALGRTAGGGE